MSSLLDLVKLPKAIIVAVYLEENSLTEWRCQRDTVKYASNKSSKAHFFGVKNESFLARKTSL